MIKNWKVTCWLASPLAGEPPKLDAILEWELAFRIGMKHARKLTRDVPLSEIERPPIPLAQRTIAGHDVYCASDPIMTPPLAEWVDYQNKRIDTDLVALLLRSEERKNLLVASGPYKMRHVPIRVRLIERVAWFVRGDRAEINKLLKSIHCLGKFRGIGYGLVDRWEYEETADDWSIYAEQHGKPVLMKTLPTGSHLENVTGFRRGFGGAFPPTWHPETFMEIAIPC
jgi:hypothetical protein